MNKNLFRKTIFIETIIFAAIAFLSGCDSADFDQYRAEPEKLRRIENMDPQQMTMAKTETADVNEAPSTMELTVEQCRAIALENNLDLKVQLINPAIAAEGVRAEQAKFETSFSSRITYSKMDTPYSSGLEGTQTDSSNVSLGLQMPLQTGGEVALNLSDSRYKTDDAWSVFSPSYSSDLSLSISQPLLRNAGRRASMYSIYVSQYQQQITDARTKLEIIRVIAAADRVYWRLYAAKRQLEVRKNQYQLAQAQLVRAERFVRAGERPEVELIRAQAGLAGQLAALITAENDYRDRQRELKQLLNRPNLGPAGQTVLSAATEPDPVQYNLDRKKLLSAAIDNRMEMLELQLQLAQDASAIDYLKNQALPLATVDYTYNINGLGPTRTDCYDLLFDKEFEDHRFGLQVLIPIGNEAAKSRLRQALYQRNQRLVNRQSRQSLIELEVLNAIDQLETNWQQILAARQSAILDGRLYEAELKQFEIGMRTSTDVLEVQAKFADSQSAEIRALAEYHIAMVDIAYATGMVLGAAKIELQPLIPALTNQ